MKSAVVLRVPVQLCAVSILDSKATKMMLVWQDKKFPAFFAHELAGEQWRQASCSSNREAQSIAIPRYLCELPSDIPGIITFHRD